MTILRAGAGTGASTEAQRLQARVKALLEERRACQIQGKLDRVKAINEELGEFAKDAEPPVKRAQKRPAAPSRRTSR